MKEGKDGMKVVDNQRDAGRNARVVYEKYCNGDPISDEELVMAIQFFGPLQENLMVLGPVFRLAALEALRIYSALESYDRARKEKRSV